MSRSYRSVIAGAVALLSLSLAPVAAQDPSQPPSGSVTPPDAYRAALVAFKEATAAESDAAGGSPTTVVEMRERLPATAERLHGEQARLAAITPDPCYADAHAQNLAYVAFQLDLLDDYTKALETATTVYDIVPLALAANAEMEARFPAFYKPGPSPAPGVVTMGSGNVFDYVLGFDVMNACGLASPSPR